MNSKGCSFIVAVLVVAAGMGVGYYKFRAQQTKALHDSRIAQWHDPLLAMLGHPAHIRFRNQAFSASGYLCGEYALGTRKGSGDHDGDPAGTDSGAARTGQPFQRFVVSPDAVALAGGKAYTQSTDSRARKQQRQYQARLDASVGGGATANQAFTNIAWAPHCH